MKKITQWQAYDGTIFDDEEECREYENEKLAFSIKDEVIFYTFDNKVINAPYNKINPNKVYGMVIRSRKAIEAVKDYFDQYGSITPDDFETEESGCWVWSDEETEWFSVELLIEEIEEKLKNYNKMLEELEKGA